MELYEQKKWKWMSTCAGQWQQQLLIIVEYPRHCYLIKSNKIHSWRRHSLRKCRELLLSLKRERER